MKNKDLYKTRNILTKWYNSTCSKNMSYAIYKNMEMVDKVIDTFDTLSEVPIEISKYEMERKRICEKFSKTDKDGNPIIEDENYVIDDEHGYDTEISSLNDRYKKVLDDRAINMDNFNKMLEDDCRIIFEKVSKEDLPDKISPKEIKELSFMIK